MLSHSKAVKLTYEKGREEMKAKRFKVLACVLSLALVCAPLSGTTLHVSAEEAGIAALSASGGNSASGGDSVVDGGTVSDGNSSTETDSSKLGLPTNLRWSDNYDVLFTGVDNCTNYALEVSKDDQPYFSTSWGYGGSKEVDLSTSPEIKESGSYRFRVKAQAAYDDPNHTDGDFTEWSEAKVYNRPDTVLGTTEAVWDSVELGKVTYTSVENAGGYKLHLYCQSSGEDSMHNLGTTWWVSDGHHDVGGEVRTHSFADNISRNGEGIYYVSITALSGDLDNYANGEKGPKSEGLDTTVNADKLGETLKDAMENQTASEAADTLTESADISAIQQAMQTSDTFLDQVKDLESKYQEETGVVVDSNVSEEAAQYVNSDEIEIVGAAFNGNGSDLTFEIDATAEEDKVPVHSNYLNNVQLDIKLTTADTEIHELKMPITITMPIPQGITPAQLVILHHHENGTVEETPFKLNGDGTVTFTVTDFSTFVFAEVAPSTGGGSTGGGSTSSGSTSSGSSSYGNTSVEALGDMISAAAPNATVKVDGIASIPNHIMKTLIKRSDVTLDMTYNYQDKEYHIIIAAGKALNDDTPWYGPLYLASIYSIDKMPVAQASTGVYVVKSGDTLSKIAHANNMSLAQLVAKNPTIKNINKIYAGQKINL